MTFLVIPANSKGLLGSGLNESLIILSSCPLVSSRSLYYLISIKVFIEFGLNIYMIQYNTN
jgi:hypothetical protein